MTKLFMKRKKIINKKLKFFYQVYFFVIIATIKLLSESV